MSVGGETVAGEVDVVADALRRVAVVAHTVDLAWRVAAQAGRVDGRCRVAGAVKCRFHTGGHLVHADDVDHVVRPPGDGGHAVAAAVDVDDDAVLGDGVGAGEEVVGVHRVEVALARLLGCLGLVAVDDVVVAAVDQVLGQTHLADGLRPAPTDAAACGNERLDELDGLGCRGTVVSVEVAALQVLDDAAR